MTTEMRTLRIAVTVLAVGTGLGAAVVEPAAVAQAQSCGTSREEGSARPDGMAVLIANGVTCERARASLPTGGPAREPRPHAMPQRLMGITASAIPPASTVRPVYSVIAMAMAHTSNSATPDATKAAKGRQV